jgi:hypothetical protein
MEGIRSINKRARNINNWLRGINYLDKVINV